MSLSDKISYKQVERKDGAGYWSLKFLTIPHVKQAIKELKEKILEINGEIFIQCTDKTGIFDIIKEIFGEELI